MNPPPALIDFAGRAFHLDRLLASGGEGSVFALPNNPAQVAKVYHQPQTQLKADKLAAMVTLATPGLARVAAWPSQLLHEARTRRVAGFVMPRLVDCQPLQHLYNPVQRLKYFPRCGWAFQLRAAVNCAAAFDEVHQAGCLVGDVNQSNVQVSSQAVIRLIDCDSFQVRANGRQYLCEVGVPHYTPPELQGKPFRGLVRTENHDRFGLAVLLFQLLFVGRHPYAGIYHGPGDPSFDQLIAEFRFAHGPHAQTWKMAPPPYTPTSRDVPPNLFELFRRAFERGSEKGTRPRASDWLPVLEDLEKNLAECTTDPGHKYWRGLPQCVWCRLEKAGGPEYYFGVAGGTSAFTVDDAKLRQVERRLVAAGVLDFPYQRTRYAPSTTPVPEPLPDGLTDHRVMATVVGVAAGLGVLAMPVGIIHCAIFIIGLLISATFGTWLVVLLATSPFARESRRRRQELNTATQGLRAKEEEWTHLVRRYQGKHRELSSAIRQEVGRCRGLVALYEQECQRHTANAEALARQRHLRFHLIADADIEKVGAGRKQVLASYQILTAADVEWKKVRDIKGFGDVLTGNLTAWRDEVLKTFRFDPSTALSPAEHRAVAVKYRAGQQQILKDLDAKVSEVEGLAGGCRRRLSALEPELRPAVAAWKQAEVDYRLIKESR